MDSNTEQTIDKKLKYRHIISFLSYLELFITPITLLFLFSLTTLNSFFHFYHGAGYGLGVMVLISMLISIFFGIIAVMLDFRVRSLLKKEKNYSDILKTQTIFIIPCLLYWVVFIVGIIFNLL